MCVCVCVCVRVCVCVYMGSLSFLQRIFPTQGLNPGLMHCWQILYKLSHKGSVYTYTHILSSEDFLEYEFSKRNIRKAST